MTAQLSISRQKLQVLAPVVRNTVDALCSSLEACKEVARRFDGKVINKRLFDAMTATSPKTDTGYTRFRITLHENRWSDHAGQFDHLEIYISDSVTLQSGIAEYLRNVIHPDVYTRDYLGPRLDAQKLINMLSESQRRCELCARDYEDMLAHYDLYESNLQKAQKAVNRALAGIPRHLRPQNFGIDFDLEQKVDAQRESKLMDGAE